MEKCKTVGEWNAGIDLFGQVGQALKTFCEIETPFYPTPTPLLRAKGGATLTRASDSQGRPITVEQMADLLAFLLLPP